MDRNGMERLSVRPCAAKRFRFGHGGAPVTQLFTLSRPATVIRFIVPIVVDAIKAFSFGPFAHISKEVVEGVEPAVAYRNSATAIKAVMPMVGLKTTRLHADPTRVGSRHAPVHAVAVTDVRTAVTATFGLASLEIVRSNKSCVAAVASAEPHNVVSGTLLAFRNNEKFSETLTDKVNLGGHRELILSGVAGQAVPAALPLNYTSEVAG